MQLRDLLNQRGLPVPSNIGDRDVDFKLSFHLSDDNNKYSVIDLYRLSLFELWQSYQRANNFSKSYVMAFITDGRQSYFVGVWRVRGQASSRNFALPDGLPAYCYDWPTRYRIRYDLEKVSGFEDLELKVAVESPKGQQRHRYFMNLEIAMVNDIK